MKNKRKTLWGLLITLGLLVGLLPVGAVATPVDSYDIWVEGEQVTSLNAADVLGDSTVSYDVDTKTLTLNNANLENKDVPEAVTNDISWYTQSSAIFAKEDLTIHLKGSNSIALSGNTQAYTHGISFVKNGKVLGDGSLNIKGEVNQFSLSGIFASKSLTIGDAAKLDIDLKSSKIILKGVYGRDEMVIGDQAVVKARGQGPDSCGIGSYDDDNTTIKDDAQVTAAGDKNALYRTFDLSDHNNTYVEVSTKADGSDATPWDGTTALGGSDSPYKYVKIEKGLYAITFDENYSDAPTPAVLATDGSGKLTTFPTDPEHSGYQFISWNTAQDGSGTEVTAPHTFSANTTLYAQWKPQFQVTFNDNYSGAPAPKVLIADSNDKVSPWPQDPVRENHTFLGWNTDPNGSGEMVGPDHAFDNNTTLYAQWKLNIPVTFDWNGAEAATTTIYTNSTGKISAYPEVPSYGDYRFSGWNTARDGSGTAITKDHVFTTDTTLYAQWQKSERGGNKTYGDYSGNGTGPLVNFDPNYADAPAAESKRADKNGKFAQLPAPKREGHLFLGWFKDKDGSGTALTADHVFTNGETVYAKWADGKDALRVIMTIGSHDYLVNDVAKTMDTVPFIENDRTFVPIRALAEAFGAEVIWDGNERSVTIKDGDKTVLMIIGDKSYRVNDESKEMDVAPFINKDNRTMIPVRFATEALGYQVDYQQKDEVAKVIFTRG